MKVFKAVRRDIFFIESYFILEGATDKMKENQCPCRSGKTYDQCCGPYLKAQKNPGTALELMRSRYTAYVQHNVDHLKKTLWPAQQKTFDRASVLEWAQQCEWKNLEIIKVEQGGIFDQSGVVEFTASYIEESEAKQHHEISQFRRGPDGCWYYVQP